MRNKKSLWIFLFLLATSVVLSGCGKETVATYKINLEVWGVFDDSDVYSDLFTEYKKVNPFIGNISYRKLDPETYKEDLINAMASGNGPDIFMIRNTWVDAFRDKTVSAPGAVVSEKILRDHFVDVVAEDFLMSDGTVAALPFSVDSLGLYYNKDILNAAGISRPPTTWEELISLIPRFTRIDEFGNITQSAVALGTAYNVNRSTDILLALAYQKGADIRSEGFNQSGMNEAFDFYTQFARSSSSQYTWNPRQHFSIDAFYEGKTAMMLNYSWHYQTIRQKNAKFNFGVASLPQFASGKTVNFANYWAYAVAKNKTQPQNPTGDIKMLPTDQYQAVRTHESWQLLAYLMLPHPDKTFVVQNALSGTTKIFPIQNDPTVAYLDATKKPAARRDLLEGEKADLQLAPFALGNLIARSWKPGNPEAVETIVAEGIDSVNRGERSLSEALSVMTNRSAQFRVNNR